MHALLHTVGAIVVVPYVALALFFLFIGQAARAKGMIALIEILWNNFFFYFTKGMFVAPVLWVCLVAMGFVPILQRTGSLCLSLLAVASFLVVVNLSSTRIELGELIFLIPCIAVAATSAWLFFRGGIGVF
ncbi:MAG: hypothetical protein IT422_16580 [Pirellulaceae bacterium]|jgi:hypothetical protein|nr:hypothetical protein [Pirellulaceae bacterium]